MKNVFQYNDFINEMRREGKAHISYYETPGGDLIRFNKDTGNGRVSTGIGLKNWIFFDESFLTKEEFDALEKKQISKHKFDELLNDYFRKTPHAWTYEGKRFHKLDNFSKGDRDSKLKNYETNWNYKYLDKMPRHRAEGYPGLIMVYFHGKVYYVYMSGNYFPRVQLIDPRTMRIVQWTNITNCAPIVNDETGEII